MSLLRPDPLRREEYDPCFPNKSAPPARRGPSTGPRGGKRSPHSRRNHRRSAAHPVLPSPSPPPPGGPARSEEHTSELQSLRHLVCRLLLEKKSRSRRKEAQIPRKSGGASRLLTGVLPNSAI